MDYSLTFARHFSRLVWLLLHETGNLDEQKAALRAVVTVSKDGPVTFASRDWRLVVNGTLLPEALTGVQELAAQLIGHAVREIAIERNAAAADLLGLARILSAEPVPGDAGRTIQRKLQALGARTLRVGVDTSGADGTAAPLSDSSSPGAPQSAPNAAGAPPAAPAASTAAAGARPPSKTPLGGVTVPSVLREGEQSGRYLAFSAVQKPKASAREVLAQLDNTRSPNIATRLLDDLVLLAETAAREGLTSTVADALTGLAKREAAVEDGELRRAYVMAIRRMSKPILLRMVATLLPRHREKADEYLAVLARTGEDGADALIEQLTAAQSMADRRIYFDALVKLKAGVSALVHMLGDARWYVARNAADLLGEMQATEAELPLIELIKHDDDRVRRAATTALAKLGTPRALQGLRGALRDTSPQVRMQAAAGLAGRRGANSSSTLLEALDEETDAEVQLTILAALGRLATSDAVQKLVKAAESGGMLFNKKPLAFRIAAIQALGEARTAPALEALKELANDKDKEIREAAFKATMQAQRVPAARSA